MLRRAPRMVVCAANAYDDHDNQETIIVTGPRHFDSTMHRMIERLGLQGKPCEQGFVDQIGKFMTREEAYQVALAAGQIDLFCSKSGNTDSKVLYSEDLY